MKVTPTRLLPITAALILALALATAAAPADTDDPPILFEDRFEGELADGWSWLREDPDGWRIGDGYLEVRKSPTGIGEARNLLLRPAPAPEHAPYAADVTVTHRAARQWEQAGLVWYYDDHHLVKLVREQVDGEQYVLMSRSQPGAGELICDVPFDGGTVRLRLIVTGDTLRGLYQDADGDWQEIGRSHLPAPDPDATPHLSLQAYHGPPEPDARWARYQDFRIFRMEANE